MDGPEVQDDHRVEMSNIIKAGDGDADGDAGDEHDEHNEGPKKLFVPERTISQSYLFSLPKAKVVGKLGTLWLAYETLGIIYGDVGTSPLYTFASIDIPNPGEVYILGYLSIIYWSLTLIGLIKYVLIVIRADDHGEGGTFALYSLLCQHLNVGQHAGNRFHRLASDSNLKYFGKQNSLRNINYKIKEMLEKSEMAQRILLIVVMFGTCMVIGDGALTPAISVLSAVQGIQAQNSSLSDGAVVGVSAAILMLLFLLQRFGTGKVSFLFSPITIVWLVSNAIIGVYNIVKYYPAVFKAVSPYYIVHFFEKNGKHGWVLLGGTVLAITGSEAMFADLGHFNRPSIQVAFSTLVYPALMLTYSGQAAYLIKNPEDISRTFYKSIPKPVYWPMFVIATSAAIVASQALISATFSIIKQSMALSCFPRVKIVQTSQTKEGRIYSPEINYILMFLCLAVLLGFRAGSSIGNAYGVAVITVMLITTCLVTLVMLVVWNLHILLVLPYFMVFSAIEGVYLSAVLNKVPKGGWAPIVISGFFLTIMFSWNYGRSKKYKYAMEKKLDPQDLHGLVTNVGCRVPGICFMCTDLFYGLPPIFKHYVDTVGSLHEVVIFLTIRMIPIKSVLLEERFLVGRLGPKGVYRCLVQYGYLDVPSLEGPEFLNQVIDNIKDYIKTREDQYTFVNQGINSSGVIQKEPRNSLIENNYCTYEEVQKLEQAKSVRTVFVTGKTILKTNKKTGAFERFVIDKLYTLLHNNCRSAMSSLHVPPAQLLQIGMLYEI
ncbi:potassium transporter 26 [Cryptomeria japonica]|uniref:potassium transporter 26 n=1 Tax=Cryptomeria japonica TaxID=3369 RepID=UPI0025AC7B14|nr:potassium transporter 26 [Cryptomeria japonica]